MASLGGYGRGRRPQPATNASNDALPAPGGGGGQMRPSDSGNSFNSMDGAGLGRGLPRPTRTFNNSVTQQSHSANASQPGRFNGSFNVTGITSSNPD
uniref:Uncharacterized protein n=1 Tax=Plectus sambesii TaxID=2011161 RepID=A0A914UQL2_9BILA